MIKIPCTAINQFNLELKPLFGNRGENSRTKTQYYRTQIIPGFSGQPTKIQDSYGPGQRDGDRSFAELN